MFNAFRIFCCSAFAVGPVMIKDDDSIVRLNVEPKFRNVVYVSFSECFKKIVLLTGYRGIGFFSSHV